MIAVSETSTFSVPGKALRESFSLLKSCSLDKASFYFEYHFGTVVISKYSKNDFIKVSFVIENAAPGKYEFPLSESCFSFVDKFKKSDFSFQILENACFITPDSSGASLRVDFTTTDKPQFPFYTGVIWKEFTAGPFLHALEFLSGMRSTKENSYLNGIEFFSNKLLSTNGFMAGEIGLSGDVPNFVLPDSGCTILEKIIEKSPEDGRIKIGLVKNTAIFSTDNVVFYTIVKTEDHELRPIKLISDIIAKCEESCTRPLKISLAEFTSKWSLFKTAKKGKTVLFTLKPNMLSIEDQSSGYSLKADVPCFWEGDSRQFKIDTAIVKLFISKISSEYIELMLSDSPAAPILHSSGERKLILQPIR